VKPSGLARFLAGVVLFACANVAAFATDYYAAYGAQPGGDCTSPALPCDLAYAIGVASGADVRIHIAGSPSIYRPQVTYGDKSMTLIGDGINETLIGSGSTDPKCAITLTTATIELQNLQLRNGSGCCGRGVCVTVPDGATASLTLNRVWLNTGNDGGRGIDATTAGSGSVTIDVVDSLIQNNGDGGIVLAGKGTVDIERSLFTHDYGNSYTTASLQISGNVTTTGTNSTFTNNGVDGTTGGIAHASNGLLTVNNVTFSGNAGFAISANVASINHSIIDGTCSISGVLGGDYSVESPGNTCSLAAATSLVNMPSGALNLGLLADNGGFTQTMLPQSGSVAIGLGGAGCEPVDQRSLARGGTCDAGAVQEGIFKSQFD